MEPRKTSFVASASLLVACAANEATDSLPDASVNEQMVAVVAPMTDRLWGANNPQTAEEWKLLDDAAVAVIEVFKTIKQGGSGPNDVLWAAEPEWATYSDEVIAAASAARRAISNRDIDALFEANDVLYPPCENCHLMYHPGFTGQ